MDVLSSLNFTLFLTAIPFYITGFVGNVLVIRIVHKTREMHTTTNYLLANLAVSDVITIFIYPLYVSSYLYGYLNDGFAAIFACKFLVLTQISAMVSALTLTVLAIERYHAILKPFRRDLFLNNGNIKRAIAFVWVLSIVFTFPEFFLQERSQKESACSGPWSLNANQASRVYLYFYSVVSTYVPLGVFLFCYGSLIKGLYLSNTICATDSDQDRDDKKKLVVTIIMATMGFVVGYGTLVVFYCVMTFHNGERFKSNLHYQLLSVFSFMFICSLSFNPVLYAFRSTNFQKGFKKILFCQKISTQHNVMDLRC